MLAPDGTPKGLSWQYYFFYFMGGFFVSCLFEGAVVLVSYLYGDASWIATLFTIAWAVSLLLYFVFRKCCGWWLGTNAEDNSPVANSPSGLRELFTMEEREVSTRATLAIKRDRERRIVIVVFLASALGIVGGFAGAYFFGTFWFYNNGPTYHGVGPFDNPTAYSNAHVIYFASNSTPYSIDTGVISVSTTASRCAAPMTIGGAGVGSQSVSFWAVDVNCCSGEPGFVGVTSTCWPSGVATDGNWGLGEVITDGSYQDAVSVSASWWNLKAQTGAITVQLRTTSVFLSEQNTLYYLAWLCLCTGPLGWPVTICMMVLIEVGLSLCNCCDPDPSKRCACCAGRCDCACCSKDTSKSIN